MSVVDQLTIVGSALIFGAFIGHIAFGVMLNKGKTWHQKDDPWRK